MTHQELVAQVAKVRAAALLYECDLIPEEWRIDDPCSDPELADVRSYFGGKLNGQLDKFFLTVSSHLELGWYLIGDFPPPFEEICCGELLLSPKSVVNADKGRAEWAKDVFADPENPYDQLWHRCRALMHLSNGDYFAWDESGRIVYLNHEGDDEEHGYMLSNSFDEFIQSYLLLGVPDPEFGWSLFTSDRSSGIDARCNRARLWMNVFQLD